jgi:hypothetical protein
MRFAVAATSFCLAVAGLTGCTTSVSVSGEAADAEVSSSATAIVVVEGTAANEGTRAEAVARFVRSRGGVVDDEALRMVGAAVDFPAVGSCAAVTARGASQARAVMLLDVGGVSLATGDTRTSLQARQLPDVADLVSGVVYSARAGDGLPTRRGEGLPSRSAYVLRVEGSQELDVAPFVVSATSPGEPSDVRVAGEDGRSGAVAITPGAPVPITWEAGVPEDNVYVDVGAASSGPSFRCLFADGGRASVPASAFASFEYGTVAVHRLHREAFRAHGIDRGEVRFDFARVVSFVRR